MTTIKELKDAMPSGLFNKTTKDTLIDHLKQVYNKASQVYCKSSPEAIIYYNSTTDTMATWTIKNKTVDISYAGTCVMSNGQTIRNNKLARGVPNQFITEFNATTILSYTQYMISRFMSASLNMTRLLTGATAKSLIDVYGVPEVITLKVGLDGEEVFNKADILAEIETVQGLWLESFKSIIASERLTNLYNPLGKGSKSSRTYGTTQQEDILDGLEL